MRIIFCDSGFSPKEVEYMYQDEYLAAKELLIPISLFSFEALKKGDITQALKNIKPAIEKEIAIYRGWMLKPELYEKFYSALLEKNIQLINSPKEYRFCHYLPESYELLKEYTPKSTFRKLDAPFKIESFQDLLKDFGNNPIIVKDYVKSQKHYWEEACFIPDASNLKNVEKITSKFISLQEDDLNEGIVFREFVPLKKLTTHSKSGMPLTKEFRLFVMNKKVVMHFKYWDEGDYEEDNADLEVFTEIIKTVESNFFTMDFAQKLNGEWIIVELGDAQVSGLAENADKIEFYKKITA